jgi:excisionase family DNA binding protein
MADIKNNDNLLTVAEVTGRLRTTRNTLYRWSKSGYLRPVKIGKSVRYLETDVNNLIIHSNHDK